MRDFAFWGIRLRAKWPLPKARHNEEACRQAEKQADSQEDTHAHKYTHTHSHACSPGVAARADFEQFCCVLVIGKEGEEKEEKEEEEEAGFFGGSFLTTNIFSPADQPARKFGCQAVCA